MLASRPPVVDDGLDEADALADALAFVLADDGLFVGWDEALAGVVDTAACAGADPEGEQVELGVGWGFFWSAAAELVLALGLGDTAGVVVGLSLGLTLGLALALELALALAEALAELAVLLSLPLDDEAGAVAVPVALLAGLVVVDVVA